MCQIILIFKEILCVSCLTFWTFITQISVLYTQIIFNFAYHAIENLRHKTNPLILLITHKTSIMKFFKHSPKQFCVALRSIFDELKRFSSMFSFSSWIVDGVGSHMVFRVRGLSQLRPSSLILGSSAKNTSASYKMRIIQFN